jgi:hypothetical protein
MTVICNVCGTEYYPPCDEISVENVCPDCEAFIGELELDESDNDLAAMSKIESGWE